MLLYDVFYISRVFLYGLLYENSNLIKTIPARLHVQQAILGELVTIFIGVLLSV